MNNVSYIKEELPLAVFEVVYKVLMHTTHSSFVEGEWYCTVEAFSADDAVDRASMHCEEYFPKVETDFAGNPVVHRLSEYGYLGSEHIYLDEPTLEK
jgi:hypothetical protein